MIDDVPSRPFVARLQARRRRRAHAAHEVRVVDAAVVGVAGVEADVPGVAARVAVIRRRGPEDGRRRVGERGIDRGGADDREVDQRNQLEARREAPAGAEGRAAGARFVLRVAHDIDGALPDEPRHLVGHRPVGVRRVGGGVRQPGAGRVRHGETLARGPRGAATPPSAMPPSGTPPSGDPSLLEPHAPKATSASSQQERPPPGGAAFAWKTSGPHYNATGSPTAARRRRRRRGWRRRRRRRRGR